jgi:hypothetical protein
MDSYNLIDKSGQLIIWCFNTIGSQQKILSIKIISYLLNLLGHITNYDFTYILWYSLST